MIFTNPTTSKELASSKKEKKEKLRLLYPRKADKRRLHQADRLLFLGVSLSNVGASGSTSCVTPRRVPRKRDTPNTSAKQYFLEYSRVLFAQKLQKNVFTRYYKKG